jgi:hypothetical protein
VAHETPFSGVDPGRLATVVVDREEHGGRHVHLLRFYAKPAPVWLSESSIASLISSSLLLASMMNPSRPRDILQMGYLSPARASYSHSCK